jgi:hypothetical protein
VVIAMDDLRQHLRDVYLLADVMREDHERWEQQRTKQRSGDRELHYRTQENALISKNDAEPGADTVSRAEVEAMLSDLADIIGSEMGAIHKEMLDGLEAQIADLRNQIATLQSKSGSVTPITRGKRDVA